MMSILGTVTICMYTLSKAERDVRRAVEQDDQLQRLAVAFRRDVHQARGATLETGEDANGEENILQLDLDPVTVTYTLESDQLVRTAERDGKTVHRESYRLARPWRGRWQVDRQRQLPLVALHLEPERGGDPRRHRPTIQPVLAALTLLPSEVASPASPNREEDADE
jgi:hypothetical protein